MLKKIWKVIKITLLMTGIFVLGIFLWNWANTQGKTTWDLADLVIIPIVLALIAYFVSRSQAKTEREIAEAERKLEREIVEDRVQETALQSYLDRMTELLLHENLHDADANSKVRSIARTRTLTILRELNGVRKGIVIHFLYESGLIQADDPIISLKNADLKNTHLVDVILHEIDLSEADLGEADLRLSDLYQANLKRATLEGTQLRGAYITYANLHATKFNGANMQGTDLRKSNLSYAGFIEVDLGGADLSQTKLKYTHFGGSNLTDTMFIEATLEDTFLNETNLLGANFRKVKLRSVDLQNALWNDAATKWPDSFIPPPETIRITWWQLYRGRSWWRWWQWWRQERRMAKFYTRAAKESWKNHERINRLTEDEQMASDEILIEVPMITEKDDQENNLQL